jgi:ATP-dependent Clp protease ATP-binding subunit ClpX
MPEDLMKFGLIPEFVGRLPVVTTLHTLTQEHLMDILVKPKNALVKQYRKFFEFDGVELIFTDGALEQIAEKALERSTGARGLRAIMEESLLGTMFDLPSRSDIVKCVVTREVVAENFKPTLLTSRADPKVQKEESEEEETA